VIVRDPARRKSEGNVRARLPKEVRQAAVNVTGDINCRATHALLVEIDPDLLAMLSFNLFDY